MLRSGCRCRCALPRCSRQRPPSNRSVRFSEKPPSGGFFHGLQSGAAQAASLRRQPAAAAGPVGYVDVGFAAAQRCRQRLARQLGPVVLLAQVRRQHLAQAAVAGPPARSLPPRHSTDGPSRRPRALEKGRIGRSRQHVAVVVALQQQGVAARQHASTWRRGMAQVGQHAQAWRRRRCSVSCSGSRASCGTVKGCMQRSPTSMSRPSQRELQQAFEVRPADGSRRCPRSSRPGCARAAPAARAQPMWSPCSWVMKIASMLLGQQPGRAQARVELAQPKPQSTSRWVTAAAAARLDHRGVAGAAAAQAFEAQHRDRLLQVVGDHLHDALRIGRGFRVRRWR